MAMIRLIPRRLLTCRSSFSKAQKASAAGPRRCSAIKWELRPGGLLVQKRVNDGYRCSGQGEYSEEELEEEKVKIRVSSTGSPLPHDISIGATSTFGELKVVLAMVTGLEPREQRLLFKGKERDDGDHLHMAGVRDMDKVLMLEDPAIKEEKRKGIN